MCKHGGTSSAAEPLHDKADTGTPITKRGSGTPSLQRYGYGWLRLSACVANIVMIIAMYFEYLWAAEWRPTPSECTPTGRHSLGWLSYCDCMHRYTFSDAMLRGQNLELFGIVGTCVAITFIVVELNRTRRLRALLESRLATEYAASAQRALSLLSVYTPLICAAFVGVLGLVPFHLERPLMHYTTTGAVVLCMMGGVCTCGFMPLQSAAGAGTSEDQDELQIWAKRQQWLRGRVIGPMIAMHLLLPATAALHHFVWHDLSGRLFGAVEVLTILSYQVFVAYLAKDDFESRA